MSKVQAIILGIVVAPPITSPFREMDTGDFVMGFGFKVARNGFD